MRRTLEYESAYVDANPLISVLILTYERLELLRSRAIPSILAQQHPNLEIVIVGDRVLYEAGDVTTGFAGAPIRYVNLPLRGPYPEEARKRWLVSGTTPLNEAMAIARGAWLAPFADDDKMRPNHLITLLAAARERRLEFVYGRLQQHLNDGVDAVLGSFPPKPRDIGLQAGAVARTPPGVRARACRLRIRRAKRLGADRADGSRRSQDRDGRRRRWRPSAESACHANRRMRRWRAACHPSRQQ